MVIGGQADVLVVHCHGDDEGIFGGGILPYYTQVLGLKVVLVTMHAESDRRAASMCEAADIYAGQPVVERNLVPAQMPYVTGNLTLIAGDDLLRGSLEPLDPIYPVDDYANVVSAFAVRNVVKVIEAYRPKIVASTHSLTGDYYHEEHVMVATAVLLGVDLARKRAARAGGTCSVNKVYLRGSRQENSVIRISGEPDNKSITSLSIQADGFDLLIDGGDLNAMGPLFEHFHDYLEEGAMNGVSPRQIANLALKRHDTEYYLDPQVATVYQAPSNETGPSASAEYAYIRQGHPSESWTLMRPVQIAEPFENFFQISARYPSTAATVYSFATRGDFLAHSGIASPARQSVADIGIVCSNVTMISCKEGTFESLGDAKWGWFGPGSKLVDPDETFVHYTSFDENSRTGRYLHLRRLPDNTLFRIDLTAGAVEVSNRSWASVTKDNRTEHTFQAAAGRTFERAFSRINARSLSEVHCGNPNWKAPSGIPSFNGAVCKFVPGKGQWSITLTVGTSTLTLGSGNSTGDELGRAWFDVLLKEPITGEMYNLDLDRLQFRKIVNGVAQDMFPITAAY